MARLAPLGLLLGFLATAACAQPATSPDPAPPGIPAASPGPPVFLHGADISWTDELSSKGATWADSAGRTANLLQLLKSRGVNAIRLRAWVDPPGGWCGSARTIAMARQARAAGFKLLLDIHYSDHWADPGKQNKPAAWRNLSFEELEREVRRYTRSLVAQMVAQDASPHMVQVGNEVTGGMLWDDGRVGGAFDRPEQWDRFAGLLAAGIAGVREGAGSGPSIETMVHVDQGANLPGCRWFFDKLLARGVEFDLIGLSYYPWWHGNLEAFSENLEGLANTYEKRIIVVETAYPWTLRWNDNEHNMVGTESRLLPGFPATPEGQAAFLREVMGRVRAAPKSLGAGVFYWEPAALSLPGHGSSWENLSLFDFTGRELPGLRALGD